MIEMAYLCFRVGILAVMVKYPLLVVCDNSAFTVNSLQIPFAGTAHR